MGRQQVRHHQRLDDRSGGRRTEVSASTGALVRVISSPSYQFYLPNAVSSDGNHVWLVNPSGNRKSQGYESGNLTELSATTGDLVKVLSGPSYGFNGPSAVSSDGTNVWVPNSNQSVTGFPTSG